jgi:hypothetical protein
MKHNGLPEAWRYRAACDHARRELRMNRPYSKAAGIDLDQESLLARSLLNVLYRGAAWRDRRSTGKNNLVLVE